jgi:hypothetical protein
MMRSNVEKSCNDHPDRHNCPDCIIDYSSGDDNYGIMIHDGGSAMIAISYCPWCGTKLATDLI